MAYHGPQTRVPGLVAGGDLSAQQYRFVKLSANKTVVICAAVTDKPLGVLQNAPANGEEATVAIEGITKMVAGAAIAFGAGIGTDTTGRAVTYTAADTTKFIVGHVISGVSNANEVATVAIDCQAVRTLA